MAEGEISRQCLSKWVNRHRVRGTRACWTVPACRTTTTRSASYSEHRCSCLSYDTGAIYGRADSVTARLKGGLNQHQLPKVGKQIVLTVTTLDDERSAVQWCAFSMTTSTIFSRIGRTAAHPPQQHVLSPRWAAVRRLLPATGPDLPDWYTLGNITNQKLRGPYCGRPLSRAADMPHHIQRTGVHH